MRYSRSIHIRLDESDNAATIAAAVKFYRGNRTDLVRDAITQHLERLYAGATSPSPVAGKSAHILDTNDNEE